MEETGQSFDQIFACSGNRKKFFYFSTLPVMVQVSGKIAHLAQK